VVPFADGNIIMLAIECLEECPVINTPLAQLTDLFPNLPSIVVGVSRNNRLFIPHSDDQLIAGDLAYVVTTKDQVRRTLVLFGHEKKEANRIVIAGGGNIGLYVARQLEKRGSATRVKLIESNRERAIDIADELSSTVVLNGSALDQKLLHEADIDQADLMVTLTNDDQVNILSAVIAKRLGCKANLVLLNSPTYHDFASTLGIDAQVNPRSVTVSKVLQHVRRGRIRAVHNVQNGAAEILEAEALETSPLVGASLRELDLPEGMRIGAVYRDGQPVTPSGSLRIKPKDRVVIFALRDAVRQVEQLFRVSLEFFV